jgi:hypothetical protein
VELLVEVLAGFLEGEFVRIGNGKEAKDLKLLSTLRGFEQGASIPFSVTGQSNVRLAWFLSSLVAHGVQII